MMIETLQLQAVDLAAQAAFYGGTLGLPVLTQTAERLTLQAGHTQLQFAAAAKGWDGAYHFAFNIPENQFAAAKAWLAARVPLARSHAGEDEFDFAHWDAHAVYAYDPAGNIVELIARHALANAAAGEFGSRSLLGVSEVGLASPDVLATVRQFEQVLGLSAFRGSVGEEFAAVGDETGLFIVVAEGRLWFPDLRQPAGAWPVTASVVTATGRRGQVSGPPYRVEVTPVMA